MAAFFLNQCSSMTRPELLRHASKRNECLPPVFPQHFRKKLANSEIHR